MAFEVVQSYGWGCADGTWSAGVDSAGNHFCHRPRNLPCSANAPPSSVGNPIDCVPGSKREVEADYRGLTLEFVRHYDSTRTTPAYPGTYTATPLGNGWRSQYERRVDTGIFNNVTTIVLTREDGNNRYFKLNGSSLTAMADEPGRLQKSGTGWRYSAGNDAIEDYDASGRLTSITERNGSTQSLAYNAQGQLTSVSDTYGRQLAFTYDSAGHRQSMTDPAGGTYVYGYDASNNLTSVTYPDQSARDYLYNETALTAGAAWFNALTGIVDENATRFASYAYDMTGRAVQTTHHASPTQPVDQYSVAFGSSTQRTVTDPRGTVRTLALETSGGISRITAASAACIGCPGGTITAVTYDANSNVSSGLDFNGKKVCYAYDLARNLETIRVEGILASENCATVLASPPNRPDVRKITTAWNTTYRLPATLTEPAAGGTRTTTFTYDGSGNLTQKSMVAPKNDGSGGTTTRTWSWTYTTHGRVLTATDPNGRVTTSSYYADNHADLGKRGNLATVTNALGHVTQISAYDAHARPLLVIDPNGLATTLAYDTRGRLTSRSIGGETTSYTHDGVGQLTQVTLPDGSYLTYTYDGAHRLTQLQDGLGNKIVYTLDAMGNRAQEQVFDPSNTLARSRSRSFDSLNRLAQDIGAASQTTGYAYDNNGNRTSATDPLGHVTTQAYDALNRLTQVLDPASGSTSYAYDAAGNLVTVTDPRNLATAYTHDGLGSLIRQVSPDTGTSTSTYDAAGNLLTRLDARGVTATYAYDALNRVTQVVYTQTGASPETQSFEYDGGTSGAANAKGHLTLVTDTSGTTRWSYTPQGRVASKTSVIDGGMLTVTHDYNAAGQLTQLALPSGHALAYTYLNNRVSSITLDATPVVSGVVATPFGPIGAWQWGNGLYTFRNFDADGRLTSWEFRNGVSVLRNNVTYDAASRITGITDPAQSALTQSFGYDALDRLTLAQSANPVAHTQQFGYDAVSNRLSTTLDSAVTTLTYAGGSNRLAALSGATTRSYAYDDAGNPTAIGARIYTYDLAHRVTAVQDSTTAATYGLNALGQRVSKALGGAASAAFVYDEQGHLLSENYDRSDLGAMFQEMVWLEDLPVATAYLPVETYTPPQGGAQPPGDPGEGSDPSQGSVIDLYYVHADHLGTPRAVTRPWDNSIVWRWDNIDPFGANGANDNPSDLGLFRFNLRFPGQYFDAETESHYNYFRDYDPANGRYQQSDPIGLKGGLNTYAYVFDPLRRNDPTGLQTQAIFAIPAIAACGPPCWIAGAVIAGGVVIYSTCKESDPCIEGFNRCVDAGLDRLRPGGSSICTQCMRRCQGQGGKWPNRINISEGGGMDLWVRCD